MHVLIVDDSAVVRQALGTILSRHSDIEVSKAADPLIAVKKMAVHRPDVIVLDLELPRMSGMDFLNQIMLKDPLPVVICSSNAAHGTSAAVAALEKGAVDIIEKPKLGVGGFIEEAADRICETVRAAARANISVRPVVKGCADVLGSSDPVRSQHARSVVAIGASTGGPNALSWLLSRLPPHVPGIVVVQHMPARFTGAFAQRLHETSLLEVKEACDGDRILPGRVLLAPGNRHLVVTGYGDELRVELDDGPAVSRHRPSVDVLFRSLAGIAARRTLALLLTGMGDDGALGMCELRSAGAMTIAQDESSCVVFGMPKEAIARGGASAIARLQEMPAVIVRETIGKGVANAIRIAT